MADVILRGCRLRDRDGLSDLALKDGRIAALAPHSAEAPAPGAEIVDVGGRLLTPGLVEAHMHLDRALLSRRVSTVSATLDDVMRLADEAKRRFTVDDIRERARTALDLAVAAGTTAMRTHVDVDSIVGLMGIEAILPLRDEYAPALDLQICAFAQEGILKTAGTEGLLRRALQMGAHVIGGCPSSDGDADRQIDIVFGLARAFDADVDFHVDFADEPEHLHIRAIVEHTLRAGWQGRVAVGHLTELAAVAEYEQDEIIAGLVEAGIGVISLPVTDLYVMGRHDAMNIRRGLTPIRRLLAAGVPVAVASNTICDPLTPVGAADLAHMTFVAAAAAHMGTADELAALLDAITVHPARILRLAEYGVAAGCRADLVAWECERAEDVVAALPRRAFVVKRGRITVEHEWRMRQRWRTGPPAPRP